MMCVFTSPLQDSQITIGGNCQLEGMQNAFDKNVVLKSSQMVPFLGHVSLGMFNLHDP
jgi:hypothetical protein